MSDIQYNRKTYNSQQPTPQVGLNPPPVVVDKYVPPVFGKQQINRNMSAADGGPGPQQRPQQRQQQQRQKQERNVDLGKSVETMFAGPINLERKQCENNPNAYYWTNNGKPLAGYSSLETDDEGDDKNGGKIIRRKSRKSRKSRRITKNRKNKKTRRNNSKKK
jgi:hypothetical protein